MNSLTQKRCKGCGEVKDFSEFHKHKNRKDNLNDICKKCNSEKVLKWQKNNPEKVGIKSKKWATAHKEQRYVAGVKWRNSNYEKMKQLIKAWADSHREKRRASVKKWQDSHPEQRALNQRNREIKKLNVGGTITIKDLAWLKDKYGDRCLCCGASGVKLTLDHVVPISKGGENSINNAQLLCGSCNSKKGTKTIDYR